VSPSGITVSDSSTGNNSGGADPGETVQVTIPLSNEHWATATGVSVTVGDGNPISVSNISSGATANVIFDYQVPSNTICGSEITLNLVITSSLGSVNTTKKFTAGIPQLTLSQNFDSVTVPTLPEGWTASVELNSPETWVTSLFNPQSFPHSAYIRNAATVGGGASLTSPAIQIQASGAIVRFAHRYASEVGWDGGVLEISSNDGPFIDVITAGGEFISNGYNGVLGSSTGNPLSGRNAWNGSSNAIVTSSVRLPANVAGTSVRLRWRFGADDNTVGAGPNPGWNIDNVEVFGAFSCNTACATPIPISVPSTSQFPGSIIEIPVNVGELTGKGVQAFDFTVNYNPAILTPASPATNQGGTIAAPFTVTSNVVSPGSLKVSGFGIGTLSGQGTLLKLRFAVTGVRQDSSAITFERFVFNEGNPCISASGGNFAVEGGEIGGIIRYFFGQNPVAVPGVSISGDGAVALNSTSDQSGIFNMLGFGAGAYTLTASKTGGTGIASISALDASAIAQFTVGLISLTANQQIAADVTNDGSISALDASRIAQYSVGLTLPAGDLTGTWKFVPASRSYSSVTSSLTGQDFIAILMGDVTGNWTP
jgi:hypothetical protein